MNAANHIASASVEFTIIVSARNVCGPKTGIPNQYSGFTDDELVGFVRQFRALCRNQPEIYGIPAMSNDAFVSTLAMLGDASALFDDTGCPLVHAFIARAKAEILRDIAEGTVKRTVRAFSELHDDVDANEYGGFCDNTINSRLHEYFARPTVSASDDAAREGFTDFFNDVQNHINTWLRHGRVEGVDYGKIDSAATATLIAAYEAFANAAANLSDAIDKVDDEASACAEDYPFSFSFDEVIYDIATWKETSVTRLRGETNSKPAAAQMTGAVVGSDRIARAGSFGIDGMVNNLAGYTFGDTWNGWQCPMFTKDVGLQLVGSWDATDGTMLRYDEAGDVFIVSTRSGNGTDTDTYVGTDVLTEDGMKRVYGIGAFGWTWDKAENVGGIDVEDQA